MTKTRALSLIDELDSDRPALARALRLAITQIPTTSWQPMETAPKGERVRLLIENTASLDARPPRFVKDALVNSLGDWWDIYKGEAIWGALRPLAWRPADSTELPEDWGQLETMPHLFPNEARQAGEHKATNTWVPIAECGELADGVYVVFVDGEPDIERRESGEWLCWGDRVTHVLSPHLGPIPEAP